MSRAPAVVPSGMAKSDTTYSIQDPTPGEAPIYRLIEKCRQAVLEYDKSDDHCRHDSGGDCVRCRVAAVVWATGAPSAQSRRSGPVPTVEHAADVLIRTASGLRPYDPVELFRSCDVLRKRHPGHAALIEAAAKAAAKAAEIRAFADAHFQPGGLALEEAHGVADSHLDEVRRCSRLLRGGP